jgi:protein SCO1/2
MRTSTIAVAAAAVALAGVAAMALSPMFRAGDAFADCRDGQVAGGDIGGPFTLVNGRGETVTDAEVIIQPSIVYFGFATCPDVCPLDLARNGQAVDILEERGVEATPVFITVDPERDTPEIVASYGEAFHPRMVSLTGTLDQVDAAADAYRVYYAKQGDDPETYLMDHSTYSYIVLPGTGFVDFVNREETPEAVAERVECFATAAGA